MLKKWIFLFAIVSVFVGSTSAQDEPHETHSIQRLTNSISSIDIARDNEQYVLVIKVELPDGCDIPTTVTTQQSGNVGFIDLYRDMPTDIVCPSIMQDYEERVPLEGLIDLSSTDSSIKIIVINDFTIEIEALNPGSEPRIKSLWQHARLPYSHITVAPSENGLINTSLTGTLTDGCAIPVVRALPDWQNEGSVIVEAYTVVPLTGPCAQVTIPFEITLSTSAFEHLVIDGASVPFDPARMEAQTFVEQELTVTSAIAEWVEGAPPSIIIVVGGTTDGCDVPIQIASHQYMKNAYTLRAVRILPDDTICPEIAQSFTQDITLVPQAADPMSVTLFVGGKLIDIRTSDTIVI